MDRIQISEKIKDYAPRVGEAIVSTILPSGIRDIAWQGISKILTGSKDSNTHEVLTKLEEKILDAEIVIRLKELDKELINQIAKIENKNRVWDLVYKIIDKVQSSFLESFIKTICISIFMITMITLLVIGTPAIKNAFYDYYIPYKKMQFCEKQTSSIECLNTVDKDNKDEATNFWDRVIRSIELICGGIIGTTGVAGFIKSWTRRNKN